MGPTDGTKGIAVHLRHLASLAVAVLRCCGQRKATFTDFRLAGKSGHPRRWHRCRLSANSGHQRRIERSGPLFCAGYEEAHENGGRLGAPSGPLLGDLVMAQGGHHRD
jgi:hypothetical protein